MKFLNISKQETKDVIPVTEAALEKIADCANIMDRLEFGCVACAEKNSENNGKRIVVDFPVGFDQFVRQARCDMTDKGYNKNISEMDRLGLVEVGIAHGHGHLGPFHSGFDDVALTEIVVPCCYINNKESSISRIYSIVVNRGHKLYAEINYLIENKANSKQQFKKETIVVPIKDSSFNLNYDTGALIKDLVTRVFFPNISSVPDAFKCYKDIYKSCNARSREERFSNFGEKIIRYMQNHSSEHSRSVKEFLERTDLHFGERIKVAYDRNNPANHFSDLIAFCIEQPEGPGWLNEFINAVNGPKSRMAIFSRKDSAKRDMNQVIEKFKDDLDSAFLQSAEIAALDDLDLDTLILEKEMIQVSAQAQLPQSAQAINQYLAPVEKCLSGSSDLALIYGYSKLSLLVSAEQACFEDLAKIMCPEINAVFSAKQSEINSVQAELAAKNNRLDSVLAEKGCQNLPETTVSAINFASIKKKLTSIINDERSNAHKLCESAMFYEESLPDNWVRKHAGKAAEYASKLMKQDKIFAKYACILPGIRNTQKCLKSRKQALHAYVLHFFNLFEQSLQNYDDACRMQGKSSENACKTRTVLQEYQEAAKTLPSKQYWYHKNKMKKLAEAMEHGE